MHGPTCAHTSSKSNTYKCAHLIKCSPWSWECCVLQQRCPPPDSHQPASPTAPHSTSLPQHGGGPLGRGERAWWGEGGDSTLGQRSKLQVTPSSLHTLPCIPLAPCPCAAPLHAHALSRHTLLRREAWTGERRTRRTVDRDCSQPLVPLPLPLARPTPHPATPLSGQQEPWPGTIVVAAARTVLAK